MEAKFPPYTARGGAPVGAAEVAEYYREVADHAAHDPVTKPKHYQRGGIETIDYIRATLGDEGYAAYCLGNVLKYVSRFREKDGVQDLKKAQVYLGWAIGAQEKTP